MIQARQITSSDAGSLYLTDEDAGAPVLRFVKAQNDSVRFDFVERALPLDDASIAGFVARTGQVSGNPVHLVGERQSLLLEAHAVARLCGQTRRVRLALGHRGPH